MAPLTAAKRNALPSNVFAGPGRSFPIEDPNHAKAALALINKGGLTPDQKANVKAKAKKMLGRPAFGVVPPKS